MPMPDDLLARLDTLTARIIKLAQLVAQLVEHHAIVLPRLLAQLLQQHNTRADARTRSILRQLGDLERGEG
jgi:hypothetical protein